MWQMPDTPGTWSEQTEVPSLWSFILRDEDRDDRSAGRSDGGSTAEKKQHLGIRYIEHPRGGLTEEVP